MKELGLDHPWLTPGYDLCSTVSLSKKSPVSCGFGGLIPKKCIKWLLFRFTNWGTGSGEPALCDSVAGPRGKGAGSELRAGYVSFSSLQLTILWDYTEIEGGGVVSVKIHYKYYECIMRKFAKEIP